MISFLYYNQVNAVHHLISIITHLIFFIPVSEFCDVTGLKKSWYPVENRYKIKLQIDCFFDTFFVVKW